jgi:hypothetical protein
MIPSSLDSIIAKIKALRALATSSNVHEAAAAAAQAEALLQKHRLDDAALEAHGRPSETAERAAEPLAWHTQHLSWWRVTLGDALVKSHGCADYVSQRGGRRCHVIVGRPSDVATVRYLYAWLSTEIARLCDQHGRGDGRSWRHSFCMGAVSAVRDATNAAKATARQAAASTALVALDRRDQEARAVLNRLEPKLRQTRGGASRDKNAYERGQAAGRAIHLGSHLSGSTGAPMLGGGR